MSVITSIRPQQRSKGRVNVFLDGRYFCSLLATVADEHGLREGDEIEADELLRLQNLDAYTQALDAALRYLSYRPRSERELRTRLGRASFSQEHVDKVVETLRQYGYVDDASFAQFWKENRDQFSPRGTRMVALELRQKGVDREVISDVLDEEQDLGRAQAVARRKLRQLTGLQYRDFRQRLATFLARRGFGYDVINEVVQQMWKEQGGPADEEDS